MTERNYCWQIHLPAELVLPAKSVCIALSAHCVTTLTYSISKILIYIIFPLDNVK
jgi:hypothetical protein